MSISSPSPNYCATCNVAFPDKASFHKHWASQHAHLAYGDTTSMYRQAATDASSSSASALCEQQTTAASALGIGQQEAGGSNGSLAGLNLGALPPDVSLFLLQQQQSDQQQRLAAFQSLSGLLSQQQQMAAAGFGGLLPQAAPLQGGIASVQAQQFLQQQLLAQQLLQAAMANPVILSQLAALTAGLVPNAQLMNAAYPQTHLLNQAAAFSLANAQQQQQQAKTLPGHASSMPFSNPLLASGGFNQGSNCNPLQRSNSESDTPPATANLSAVGHLLARPVPTTAATFHQARLLDGAASGLGGLGLSNSLGSGESGAFSSLKRFHETQSEIPLSGRFSVAKHHLQSLAGGVRFDPRRGSAPDVNMLSGLIDLTPAEQLAFMHRTTQHADSPTRQSCDLRFGSIPQSASGKEVGEASAATHSPTSFGGLLRSSASSAAGLEGSSSSISSAASSSKLLNSPKDVEQHIAKLISDNETVLQPPPLLLKKRHSRSSACPNPASLNSPNPGSGGSISPAGHSLQQQGRAGRSQSLIDTSSLAAAADKLCKGTSGNQLLNVSPLATTCGLPEFANVTRPLRILHSAMSADAYMTSPPPASTTTSCHPIIQRKHRQLKLLSEAVSLDHADSDSARCKFCSTAFRNVESLNAHEWRCGRRDIFAPGAAHSFPRLDSLAASVGQPADDKPTIHAGNLDAAVPMETGERVSEMRSAESLPAILGGSRIQFGISAGSPVHQEFTGVSGNKHPLKKRILAAAESDASLSSSSPSSPTVSAPLQPANTNANSGEAQTATVIVNAMQSTDRSLHTKAFAVEAQSAAANCGRRHSSAAAVWPSSLLQWSGLATADAVAPARGSDLTGHAQTTTSTIVLQGSNESASAIQAAPQTSLESAPFQPYCLTLKLAASRPEDELSWQPTNVPHVARWHDGKRRRLKQHRKTRVTDCLKTIKPHAAIMDKTEASGYAHSMYENWPQPNTTNGIEAKMLSLLLGSYQYRRMDPSCTLNIESGITYATAQTDLRAMNLVPSSYNSQKKSSGVAKVCEGLCSRKRIISTSNATALITPKIETGLTCETSSSFVGSSDLLNLAECGQQANARVCNGRYRTAESSGAADVKGHGSGRCVCERCGIRCKKLSMLKKHIRTHLNVRPYDCKKCMFSFKTKGNLMKHLKSKAQCRNCEQRSMATNNAKEIVENKEAEQPREHAHAAANWSRRSSQISATSSRSSEFDDDEDYELSGVEYSRIMTTQLRCFSASKLTDEFRKGTFRSALVESLPERSIRTPPAWSLHHAVENEFSRFPPLDQPERCESAPLDSQLEEAYDSDRLVIPSLRRPSAAERQDASERWQQAFSVSDTSFPAATSLSAAANASALSTALQISVSTMAAAAVNSIGLNRPSAFKSQTNNGGLQVVVGNALGGQSSPLKLSQPGSSAILLPRGRLSGQGPSYALPYIVGSDGEGPTKCDICGKECGKNGQLRLHMKVHMYEQSGRRQELKCPKCLEVFRSKGNLQRHLVSHEAADHVADNKTSEGHPNSSRSDTTTPQSSASASSSVIASSERDPRPFRCDDCDIKFRIRGHLSKHLRSKLHITKMECVGKLPIGTYAKLEENIGRLTEIEAYDCESFLRTLSAIAEELLGRQPTKPVVTASPEEAGADSRRRTGPPVSLAHTTSSEKTCHAEALALQLKSEEQEIDEGEDSVDNRLMIDEDASTMACQSASASGAAISFLNIKSDSDFAADVSKDQRQSVVKPAHDRDENKCEKPFSFDTTGAKNTPIQHSKLIGVPSQQQKQTMATITTTRCDQQTSNAAATTTLYVNGGRISILSSLESASLTMSPATTPQRLQKVSPATAVKADVWIPPAMAICDLPTTSNCSTRKSSLQTTSEDTAAVTEHVAAENFVEVHAGNGYRLQPDMFSLSKNHQLEKTLNIASPPTLNLKTGSSVLCDNNNGPTKSPKCRFCGDLEFQCAEELEVHLYSDHFVRRDGNGFLCPRCDGEKVIYPSRDNLRAHIASHAYYFRNSNGGSPVKKNSGDDFSLFNLDAANNHAKFSLLNDKLRTNSSSTSDSRRDSLISNGSTNSDCSASSLLSLYNDVSSPPCSIASSSSTATSSGKKRMKTHLVKLNSITEVMINSSTASPTTTHSGRAISASPGDSFEEMDEPSSLQNGPSGCSSLNNSPVERNSGHFLQSPTAAGTSNIAMLSPTLPTTSSGIRRRRQTHTALTLKRKSLDEVLTMPAAANDLVAKRRALTPDDGSVAKHQQQACAMTSVLSSTSTAKTEADGFNDSAPTLASSTAWPSTQGQLLYSLALRQQLIAAGCNPFSRVTAFSSWPENQKQQMSTAMIQQPFSEAAATSNYATSIAGSCNSNTVMSSAELLQLLATAHNAAGFQCGLCGRSCATRQALEEHLVSHTMPRPFICEKCDGAFSNLQRLHSHRCQSDEMT